MEELLKKRTKNIAIMVWKNCQNTGNEFKDYKNQLIRCSSSVGANYRAACRAKSGRDFLNKLKIVEEELDETMYFIELIIEIKPELKTDTESVAEPVAVKAGHLLVRRRFHLHQANLSFWQ